MSDLPASWSWTTLEDLAAPGPRAMTDGPFGSNLKSSHYVDSGPRVIRLQNIGFGEFIDEKACITEQHFEALRAHEARADDLVVASLGQDLPRACLVPPALGRAIVKADCIRTRLHPSVNPRYVNYALQRPELRQAIADQVHGVGRPRLGMAGIKDLSIPLAPRAEQERIVAAIEEHLSRLDAAEGALGRVSLRLPALAGGIMAAAFEEAVPMVEIRDVAAVGSGATPKRTEGRFWDGGEIPWVTSGALNCATVTQPSAYVTRAALAETSVKLWPAGTVLVAMYGEGKTRGRAAELAFESTCNQACAAIRPDLTLMRPRFLRWFLNSRYQQHRRLASGGVQPNLSLGLVKAMKVPLLSLEEQDTIVEGLEGSTESADCLDRRIAGGHSRARTLRISILGAAFSGHLVPQDPNDEPASVLLERFRAERATATSKERTRRARAS